MRINFPRHIGKRRIAYRPYHHTKQQPFSNPSSLKWGGRSTVWAQLHLLKVSWGTHQSTTRGHTLWLFSNIDTEKNIILLPHIRFYTELLVSFGQRGSMISGHQEQRFLWLIFTSFLSSHQPLCVSDLHGNFVHMGKGRGNPGIILSQTLLRGISIL